MAQSLPAEKRHKFENTQEYVDLEEQIATLSGKTDANSAKRRKGLYDQCRKLLDKELRKWQRLQLNKLEPGGVEIAALEGHHRTIFGQTRFLMPECNCLASSLLKVTPLRSPVGLAALRDLVALYLKETEIEVRPGLEPEKYSCLTVAGEQKPTQPGSGSTKTAYSWKHIYSCY